MRSMDRAIAAVSASSLRQKTVLRMMTGGSAGFSTMIALPLRAPPTVSMARAGSGGLAGDRGDDLGVMHGSDAAHRGDDGDRSLAAAAHHADVGRIEVRAHVDDRHNIGSGRRRREVDHLLESLARELAVARVSHGGSR